MHPHAPTAKNTRPQMHTATETYIHTYIQAGGREQISGEQSKHKDQNVSEGGGELNSLKRQRKGRFELESKNFK